jgi:uncharacterized protein (TIGR03435 family)
MARQVAAVILVLTHVAALDVSGRQSSRTRFEVASVRQLPAVNPPTAESIRTSVRANPGRIDIRNTSLRTLVLMAFPVEPFQIELPSWMNRDVLYHERFDVQATVPEGASRASIPEMLRMLLEERFGLRVRAESRRIPVYDLVVSDGGPRFKEVAPVNDIGTRFSPAPGQKVILDDVATPPVARSLIVDNNEVRTIVTSNGLRMITARSLYDTRQTERMTRELVATRISMPELATILSERSDRPVIDRTELAGVYELRVELPMIPGLTRDLTDREGNPIQITPSGRSLVNAVRELGLRLDARESDVDVVVVESIERNALPN